MIFCPLSLQLNKEIHESENVEKVIIVEYDASLNV